MRVILTLILMESSVVRTWTFSCALFGASANSVGLVHRETWSPVKIILHRIRLDKYEFRTSSTSDIKYSLFLMQHC